MLYNSQQTCYTKYIRYISFCIEIVRFYISEKCQKGVEHHEVYHYRKNIDVTPGLKQAVESKLGKLERYFTPETEIHVTLSVQKEHQKIEVTIPVKGTIIRSEQVSSDMYVSIDLVEEVIERQLRKYKNKLVARQQEGGNFKQEFFDTAENTDEDEIKIVRTKKFGIKPMYPEDACIQMELLGHDFYVFCNAETEEVNVVYKRKNGSFGLIEPEFS
jgi:Sigma 54 modulation protein / S30EA ribosomal protein